MTLALVKGQIVSGEVDSAKAVDKWKVFRDACEARDLLGITQPALAVLNALLSFYPETMLKAETGLVVFPSNNHLAVRAHGISGTTLRRHLAALVDAGLVIRKDSPNGKRYARRDKSGSVETAFGFNLAPMLVRAEELARLALQVATERKALRVLKEELTLCRRDVRKLISAAVEEGAAGDWERIDDIYIDLVARIPRTAITSVLAPIAEEMAMLREEIVNILEMQIKIAKTDGNDDQIGCHIQNSKSESNTEFEPSFEKTQDESPKAKNQHPTEAIKAFPLSMVMRACPTLVDYAPGQSIGSWREFMGTAVFVRSMLGISPSAYQEACDIMGQEGAAVAMACILERGGHINSPGGYLRDLTRRAERGEFSLGPVLMALIRANGTGAQKTG